jgi:hypothetical protein
MVRRGRKRTYFAIGYLKYLHKTGYNWETRILKEAAAGGQLKCLKFLVKKVHLSG